ncbi:hypothetical protein CC86DRAFT_377916 [Ophiobolus disseminans]|uniref:Uncharacterized protein n=1 Tax=Ophiobolus disseminans TaxID=1469910 RepID=A0A6A7ACX0_9PLEO|nr:hypothetical protein CC86DRAFT_377916 [Ophiobolus disseminans]
MSLEIPTVTINDLVAFHAQHFPNAPTPEHILHGVKTEATEEYYEEEDDSLGYYRDGTKRTLTDEQIAMFRHSEIQAILRKRRLQRERREAGEVSEEGEASDDAKDAASLASAPTNSVQPVQPKSQQWATSSARTKAKNKRNRDRYKIKKRQMRLNREQKQSESPQVKQGDEESDEWDPWHQANGPDVLKEEALDLDY